VTQRLFTLPEANALLAEIRPAAERMVDLRRHHLEAIDRRDALEARIGSNGGGITRADVAALETEVEQIEAALAAVIDSILSAGVQVKDIEAGLLDFPSQRDDEIVLLCWRVGEDEIEFWHRQEEGFAGRKPVDPVE
jgi:hypothetical protein